MLPNRRGFFTVVVSSIAGAAGALGLKAAATETLEGLSQRAVPGHIRSTAARKPYSCVGDRFDYAAEYSRLSDIVLDRYAYSPADRMKADHAKMKLLYEHNAAIEQMREAAKLKMARQAAPIEV